MNLLGIPPVAANENTEGDEAQLAAWAAEIAADRMDLPGPLIQRDLKVAFADELASAFEAPDELVQGLLTSDAGSLLFGSSNSGKTFLAIDIACAVARGVPWMNRRTEQGLVVYIAAESPSSVRSRLQAYQQHHGVRIHDFAIVQAPIDLFTGEDDTDAIINFVRCTELLRGKKVRLIVGDTLARLSAGANENAAQDMSQVVRRFDRIRTECNAHFMLVHHSGKAASAGARGWSGIRAAMDTEIEVIESATSRTAEITKQRDLNTKGERIGFQLEGVTLGSTKWGTPATSCVVTPAIAAKRQVTKRTSEVGAAIVELLNASPAMKKSAVVGHLKGVHDKSAVYRQLKTMVEAGEVLEHKGTMCLTKSKGADGAEGAEQ